jgi:hypothetical protein
MSTEHPTPAPAAGTMPLGVSITPAQGRELARLIEMHQPDMVVIAPRGTGHEMRVTLLCTSGDLQFVVDLGGTNWRALDHATAA